jgi:hypothetical protein
MRIGIIIHTAPDGAVTVAAGPGQMSEMEAAYPSLRKALVPRAKLALVDVELGAIKRTRQSPNVGQSESLTTEGDSAKSDLSTGSPASEPRRSRKLTGIG